MSTSSTLTFFSTETSKISSTSSYSKFIPLTPIHNSPFSFPLLFCRHSATPMARKQHLHELLKQDQEPFLLSNFINDRRSLLKRSSFKSHFHLKNPKPISHSPDFSAKFCRSTCFFSFNHSPDLANSSPLFGFQSPVKTPYRSPNPVFFHVPARTAGLLLEAALRIQKQSTAARSKSFGKSNGLGLLGSFLKRLTHRSRSRKREIHGDGRINDPRDGPPLPAKMAIEENEKENDSVFRLSNVTGFDFCESNLCDSPFRFVLQSSSSPGHRTPELSSPVSSPARLDHQVLLIFITAFGFHPKMSWLRNCIFMNWGSPETTNRRQFCVNSLKLPSECCSFRRQNTSTPPK